MLIRAVPDPGQYERIWTNRVIPLNGEYRMND
jgi:hypothetical protein